MLAGQTQTCGVEGVAGSVPHCAEKINCQTTFRGEGADCLEEEDWAGWEGEEGG